MSALIDDLNLLDGSWYAEDPHAIFDEMRRSAPVHYDPVGAVWGIFKHADVLAVEKDAKTFSSHRAPRPHGQHLPTMISMDDPEHQRRRSLVNRGFTPKRVAAHQPMMRQLCRQIINGVCEQGSCDFVWDIAARLPLYVIAELMGYEPELYDDLLRWSEEIMGPTSAEMVTPEQIAKVLQSTNRAIEEFNEAQLGIIANRRQHPRDDVITTLCQAEIDGERLDDESIVQEMLLILIGGDELIRHADQREALRSGAADMAVAAEEMIRWNSPVQNMGRTATRDLTLRGQRINEGDQLMLFYPSANRDEEVFEHPHEFDIGRNPNPHVAFGIGTHFCLGASLARLEVRMMMTEALRRLPGLELAAEAPLPRRASNFVSGLESMPVTFTPTAVEG
jgi:cytochrome P450 family 142 subfamily A polypeptide 1